MNNPKQKRMMQVLLAMGSILLLIFIAMKGYDFGQWLYHQFH